MSIGIAFIMGFFCAYFLSIFLKNREDERKKQEKIAWSDRLPPILAEMDVRVRSGWKDSVYKYEVLVGNDKKYVQNRTELETNLPNMVNKKMQELLKNEDVIKVSHEIYNS